MACRKTIDAGASIKYHFGLRRFVHSDCQSTNIPDRIPPPNLPAPPQATIPTDVLGPDSPLNKLSHTYRQEAVRWVQFHSECEAIPGIHIPFNTRGVQRYLSHRARTTKCFDGIKCAIKKMGVLCGHELHTSKYQQPSIQYNQLSNHCHDLRKGRRLAGLDGTINEAIGLGNFFLSRVLASFDMRSYRRFRRCDRWHRTYAAMSVMLHPGAIRFGLFEYTDPMYEDICFRDLDDMWLLSATWRKTGKSNRPYTIRIPKRPPPNHPARYVLPGRNGPSYVTAGHIIEWYLRSEAELGQTQFLFPLLINLPNRRSHFQTWLREVARAAIPEAADFIHLIRPHGLRAGWATNRSRQDTPSHVLAAEGRWSDIRAMLKYVRTILQDVCRTGNFRVMTEVMRASWPFAENF